MAHRSKKRKLKPLATSKTEPSKPGEDLPVKKNDEKTFDFGGLPSRDLKKNLGCG
jgi:hypothetical protein